MSFLANQHPVTNLIGFIKSNPARSLNPSENIAFTQLVKKIKSIPNLETYNIYFLFNSFLDSGIDQKHFAYQDIKQILIQNYKKIIIYNRNISSEDKFLFFESIKFAKECIHLNDEQKLDKLSSLPNNSISQKIAEVLIQDIIANDNNINFRLEKLQNKMNDRKLSDWLSEELLASLINKRLLESQLRVVSKLCVNLITSSKNKKILEISQLLFNSIPEDYVEKKDFHLLLKFFEYKDTINFKFILEALQKFRDIKLINDFFSGNPVIGSVEKTALLTNYILYKQATTLHP